MTDKKTSLFDVASVCRIGGRDYNQDFIGHEQVGDLLCIAVADGLGSYNGSDIASRTAVTFILEKLRADYAAKIDVLSPAYTHSLIGAAHNAILARKRGNPEIENSCTTISVVISNGEITVVSHIGDSRVHIVENGKIAYQTRDHSLAQLYVDRGEITRDQLRHHKDQNKLLRVLGSHQYTGPDTAKHTYCFRRGDGFAVMTDGVWEYVLESELEQLFSCKTDALTVTDRMEKLIEARAPEHNDNYSMIIAIRK